MSDHSSAQAQEAMIAIDEALGAFVSLRPDVGNPEHRVAFGTSGHRGTSVNLTFNEDHIYAICQAISEYRRSQGIDGSLFLGKDTHALSEPAARIAKQVFNANGDDVVVDSGSPFTPTPVLSHAVLRANRRPAGRLADAVILTPSHNPPEDGGIKYNPPNGGAADVEITSVIERRANHVLEEHELDDLREHCARSLHREYPATLADLRGDYVTGLRFAVDMDAIAQSGIRIGVDPMGGSSLDYWQHIADTYGLNIDIVNPAVDPAFGFMPPDWDGRIRMDCSSPYAMAGLIQLRERFDIAFGLDPDADRHGIVTPSGGLMNPNHFLAVAVWHLIRTRRAWPHSIRIGKTVVSSSMINRVAESLDRDVFEAPVGFKWFVEGLHEGSLGFAGEESAGATFLRTDATPWTTDKDGIVMSLLAAEITAVTGRDPSEIYQELEERFGSTCYRRIDAAASSDEKKALKSLSAADVTARDLAGDNIVRVLTHAPGNGAAIGGIKVETAHGWFAARPSGTEDVYKLYAESFRGEDHLNRIIEEAKALIATALRGRAVR